MLGDSRSFPIGAAVIWLVGNATQPLVLFLEKDFALLENEKFVTPRLDEGLTILQNNEADVVRFRSRLMAGAPNYARGMFQGREHAILQRQVRLFLSLRLFVSFVRVESCTIRAFRQSCLYKRGSNYSEVLTPFSMY